MQTKSTLRQFATVFALGLLSLTFLGCGWQLRGQEQFNPFISSVLPKLESVNVVSENRSNAFFRIFKNSLLRQNILLDAQADISLELGSESIRRQPLTYNRIGVPAQYQLSLSLRYFASKQNTSIVEERSIVARRNYDFDPDLIIAKDREEQELLEEMRYELANRIISSIRQSL